MLSRCDSVTQGLWTPGIVCDVARISRSHTLKGHKCWHKCQWLRWPGDSTKTARWWCSCLRVYGSQKYSIRIFKGRGSKEPGLWKWSKCLGTEKWSHLKSVRLSRWVKARKSRHFCGCIIYTGTSLLDEKSTSAQLVFCKVYMKDGEQSNRSTTVLQFIQIVLDHYFPNCRPDFSGKLFFEITILPLVLEEFFFQFCRLKLGKNSFKSSLSKYFANCHSRQLANPSDCCSGVLQIVFPDYFLEV